MRKGVVAAWQNLVPMLVLQAAMAAMVVIYYFWPAGSVVLARYAAWQHSGGVLVAALATAVAGGVLSELSLVYFRDGGRWTAGHLENMGFRLVMFFISGSIVYEFYGWQTVWFGEGTDWSILVPKILVDQFIFTVVWATPYQALMTRCQILRYSGRRLWQELNWDFLAERVLPLLITGWVFWIPGVTIIYSMPSNLQAPLFIFGTAIWGLLLPAVARQDGSATGASEVVLA